MDQGFREVYSNATFRSKLMFGLETWGGSSKTTIAQVQRLQDQAAKLALPPKYTKLSARQREKSSWLASSPARDTNNGYNDL